ncbi:hypothetical protein PR048_003075 [Dryococelus australis]|uniref:Uncharacterized protein n=1 Tax=Dryococelus australis TaxID=614101 RepID=A0ABQ9IM03_9NEOP|nr:hypothetical protein PR048_003075 [Dryococelus australis]
MEQHRDARAREAGDPRENPQTSGIVRHDSHMRKSGGSSSRVLNLVRLSRRQVNLPTSHEPIKNGAQYRRLHVVCSPDKQGAGDKFTATYQRNYCSYCEEYRRHTFSSFGISPVSTYSVVLQPPENMFSKLSARLLATYKIIPPTAIEESAARMAVWRVKRTSASSILPARPRNLGMERLYSLLHSKINFSAEPKDWRALPVSVNDHNPCHRCPTQLRAEGNEALTGLLCWGERAGVVCLRASGSYRLQLPAHLPPNKRGDTHKTPYDRVKRCWEREMNIKASERVNVDVFTQIKRPCPQHSHTQFLFKIARLFRETSYVHGEPGVHSNLTIVPLISVSMRSQRGTTVHLVTGRPASCRVIGCFAFSRVLTSNLIGKTISSEPADFSAEVSGTALPVCTLLLCVVRDCGGTHLYASPPQGRPPSTLDCWGMIDSGETWLESQPFPQLEEPTNVQEAQGYSGN